MRYNQIRETDIANGEGIGVALFVQGCRFRCPNCFNTDTWDFNGGKEWNEDVKNKLLSLTDRPYIKRISILGGEPLAEENLPEVLNLVDEINISFPGKTIWLYTGFRWDECLKTPIRKEIVEKCNVVVDGKYIDDLRDITLKWRGSSNQRVIDVKESMIGNKVILYCD